MRPYLHVCIPMQILEIHGIKNPKGAPKRPRDIEPVSHHQIQSFFFRGREDAPPVLAEYVFGIRLFE